MPDSDAPKPAVAASDPPSAPNETPPEDGAGPPDTASAPEEPQPKDDVAASPAPDPAASTPPAAPNAPAPPGAPNASAPPAAPNTSAIAATAAAVMAAPHAASPPARAVLSSAPPRPLSKQFVYTPSTSPEASAPKSTRVVKAAKRWLPLALIGLVLAVAGVAATFMLLTRARGGPALTSKVPNDLDVYVEVPSLERLMVGLSTMCFLDQKKLDVDCWVKDANAELGQTLNLTDDEAKQILEGVEAMGVAARIGDRSFEGALVVRFRDTDSARVFLSSERFFEADDEGTGGKRYLIDRKGDKSEEEPPDDKYDPTLRPSVLDRDFFGVRLQGNEVVAWFKDERLVVVGHEILVDDVASVLKGKHKSLDENKRFQQARDQLPRSVAAFGFVDSQMFEAALGRRDRDKLDYFLKKPEPIIASLRFEDAGSRFTISAGFSGKLVPPDKAYTEPVSITLNKRLPKEVIGYVALSTKMGVPGRDIEQMVLDNIDDAEPALGREIRSNVADAERALGFRLTSLYDALGDEGIVAVMPHKGYVLDLTKTPSIAEDFAVAYVQHTSNAEDAKRIVRKIQESAFPEKDAAKIPYRVRREEEGGFTAEPNDPSHEPYVMVKFSGPHVMAAVGRREVCERFWSAFTDGSDTLAEDDAHASAIDELPSDRHAYAWLDTGRLFEEALKANPGLEKDAQQLGFEPAAIATTGDKRLTSAMSLGWSVSDEVWTVKLDSLNTSWQLPIAAYVEHVQDQMRTRTFQARSTVKAIAMSADAAFRANRFDWRNYTDGGASPVDRLCRTATPVPATIPPRTGYTPSDDKAQDWNVGDDKTGWKCLKFSLSKDMYYRYTYSVGGGYKGPARGGPDPGPNGFEVAAEGDLDGDGTTSLFTMTGTIDAATGDLTLATTEFAVDELE